MSTPEKQYYGLMGAIVEAADIEKELGCTPGEAYQIQRERSQARLRELEEAKPSNVIQFPERTRAFDASLKTNDNPPDELA